MTIDKEASFWPTEHLLLREGRKHYRTNVSPIHWQLRSLISAERQDILYFPAGVNNTHITRLNTTTRECETVKVVNFDPRCLVAKAGYICCGGESGEFTVIRESSPNETTESSSQEELRATVTSLSSATITEASLEELQRDMFNVVNRINGSTKIWSCTSHKFGHERVNCITIWTPPDDSRLAHYSCPVAVLANNDKTVTIVGLHDSEAIEDLDYPDCVNRAVISPDGTLLVAICDDPFLYVHERRSISKGKREFYEWVPLPRVRLKGQWPRDTSDCRGSFAACFSPSGRYLAVGTQYGAISIFDVAGLHEPDMNALITYFNSARSPGDNGAVRDMAFSPGPYDLLAWTEHRGRIGVADARTNFKQRQIIALDNHEVFDHYSLNERSTIDPRLLDPRTERNTASPSTVPSALGQIHSRPLPNPDTSDLTPASHPFTPDETAVLEAVQSDRRRREAREQREQRDPQLPRGSAGLRSSIWADRVSPQGDLVWLQNHIETMRQLDRARLTQRSVYLIDGQRENLTRILERERNQERRDQHRLTTTGQTSSEQDRDRRAPTPRRRSSIMQALTQNVDSFTHIVNRASALNNETSGSSRESPSWLGRQITAGWSDLDSLYNASGGDAAQHLQLRPEPSSRIRRAIPVISDVWSDDVAGFRRTYGRVGGSREHQQHTDDTAGLTWSEDGRRLYIGAEDGIYEFQINLQGRKIFPEVTLR